MIKSILTAFSILTIFPVKVTDLKNAKKSVKFFPFIGVILSLIPFIFLLLDKIIPIDSFSSGILSLLLITFSTGGLHLDGLADTFDGFGSRKAKNDILIIFKDSRLGSFGVLALTFNIILKTYAYFRCFLAHSILPILVSLVFARIAQGVFLIYLPNINPNGIANAFHINIKREKFIILILYTFTIIVFSIFCPIKIILISLILMIIILYSFGKLCLKKINGINGDCIGALNELVEFIILIFLLNF